MTKEELDAAKSNWWSRLQDFGEEVLRPQRREKLGLTQAQMAKRIGVDQSRISRIEQGGGKPKDYPTAQAYATAYQLNKKQTRDWFHLLFGNPSYDVDSIEALLQNVWDALNLSLDPDLYNYFTPLRNHHRYAHIDAMWEEIHLLLRWVLHKPKGYLKGCLLVELARSLMHYLDVRGYYQDRISLALAAAQVARELERKTVEGWLRCDAIPWTLMEQYNNPVGARRHLKRALQLAQETKNTDMMALATAFLARTYLLQMNIKEAETLITQCFSLNCLPEVQNRVHWIAGDIACEQGQFNNAFTYYERGSRQGNRSGSFEMGGDLRLGQYYLAVGEATHAQELFNGLLAGPQTINLSPYKIAGVKFRLAQAAAFDKDVITAKQCAREADKLLQPLQITPQLKLTVQQFLATLKPPAYISIGSSLTS